MRRQVVFGVLIGVAAASWPLSRGTATGAGPDGRVLDVRQFGAVGDGATDCTGPISQALAAAHAGPATVRIPAPGVYLTGPLLINHTDGLTLEIQTGATLRSLGWAHALAGHWPTATDIERWNQTGRAGLDYAPVLWLQSVHNVLLTGGGVLDGVGESGWWQSALRPPAAGFVSCPLPSCPHCVESCPARPRLLLVKDASLVSLVGLELRHSPFWTLHLFNSTDVEVSRVRIRNPSGLPHGQEPFVRDWGYGPNADGIDVEHSQRVLIDSCDIECGDDAICLKAGFGPSALPGTSEVLGVNNSIFTSCPHVVMSNNGTPGFAPPSMHRNDGCGGIKLGYGTFSGISDVRMERNVIKYAGQAIKITGHLGMGGPIRNVSFFDNKVVRAGLAVNVDLAVSHPTPGVGPSGTRTDPGLLSTVDGLSIVRLSAAGSVGCYNNVTEGAYCGGAGCLLGSELAALRNVRLEDVNISSSGGQSVGWSCADVTPNAVGVQPASCVPAGIDFVCSQT